MRRLVVFMCGLLLCGSALANAAPDSPPHASSDPPFDLSGRISVHQQDRTYYGTLVWQHTADTDDLTLSGPLGQGMAELHRDKQGAVLQTSDHKRYFAPTLEDLAGRLFGVNLPLAQLPGWIRGIAPADAQLDDEKRPRRLILPDWTIEWLHWSDDGRLLLISLEGPDVAVRLRIDSWREGAAASGAGVHDVGASASGSNGNDASVVGADDGDKP